ncbi:zf-HC2 domain-containing protein [Streptomyces sp. NBC_01497]|uniref:zf-HC2 domain-containing protein n=1 Tax=Streptomyces sp. NBC_01497 TaxID=2903885 RepID=UPI002E2FFA29|nr:zf-HC2 domain-containing protein [Streptomyces sp. NBC_01497]
MTTHDAFGADEEDAVHDAVGAYVLGVLDDADATAFETHLAGCEVCAARLEEFSGMEPMLALLADGPGGFPAAGGSAAGTPGQGSPASGSLPPPAPRAGPAAAQPSVPGQGRSGDAEGPPPPAAEPAVSVRPGPHLLDRLVDEVAARRAKRGRRGLYLAAAAAVVIVGGPVVAVVATSGDRAPATSQAAPANTESSYFNSLTTKYSATDPTTKVSATIALKTKAWGTDAVMELKNVKGPLKCRLVAVSASGDREVVTSWSVPAWGYGVPGSPHAVARQPLYVHGGAAVQPKDIDHFDVTTFDGKRLVTVPA